MYFALMCIWIPLNIHITQTDTRECVCVTSEEQSRLQYYAVALEGRATCPHPLHSPMGDSDGQIGYEVISCVLLSYMYPYFVALCAFVLTAEAKHASVSREQLSFSKHDGHGTAIRVFLPRDLVTQETCSEKGFVTLLESLGLSLWCTCFSSSCQHRQSAVAPQELIILWHPIILFRAST